MEVMKLSNRQVIGIVLFIIINLVVIVYLFALSNKYSTNPFSLTMSKTNLPIRLYYPPPDSDKLEPIIVSLWFNVTANSTISENTPIELTNFTGHVYVRNDIGISFVGVGFFHTNLNEGHIYYLDSENKTVGPALTPVGLQAKKVASSNSSFFDLVPWHIQPPFSFPVAGDYSPTMTVTISNYTFQHTYNEVKIHVSSKSELQTQELDQINVFIAFALLVFADVEFARLIYELTKTEKNLLRSTYYDRFKAWASRRKSSKHQKLLS